MNFKEILSYFLLISMVGCGLKRAPKAPQNTSLPSIPKAYMFKLEKEKKEKKADLEQNKN